MMDSVRSWMEEILMFGVGMLHKRNCWILFVCLFVSVAASAFYYRDLQEHSRGDIRNTSVIYTARTESIINTIFHKTDILATVIKLRNGQLDDAAFDTVARTMYRENSGIRGIQSMPGAVVTNSYPVEGNEAVIGKNFFEIPERQKDVWLAIDTKSIALSGPYHLLQGGLGVVARNPIFLTDAEGNEYFWGFSTIILDLPQALDSVELEHLLEDGYDYQLSCINENGERLVIAGNPALDIAGAVCSDIQVPHHVWTLAIVDRHAWVNEAKAGTGLLIGILLSVILWLQYSLMLEKEATLLAKDRFFSDISHDMRTPLNAVIGFSLLGQKTELSAADKDGYLKKIESSGKLLLDLINDTLTISKANMGKLQLKPAPVDIAALMESILEPIRIIAKEKQITLHFSAAGYRPRTVLADVLNVQKIFLNLLNNAVKYTSAGGNVWVTMDEADGALQVKVRDDGIGMDRDFIAHMYEPFAQEQRDGYAGTGTGLGLAIVHQLVDLMGGTIAVESEMNRGTTFAVCLPLPETRQAGTGKAAAKAAPDLSKLKGKKLLLCEDNALNREIVCELLRDLAMEVDAVENGKLGVEKFSASHIGEYSAVLMDIRMPVMDGYTATRLIRGLERPDAATIPVFAVTADAFLDDQQKGKQAGMSGYLTKPIDPSQLAAALYGAL